MLGQDEQNEQDFQKIPKSKAMPQNPLGQPAASILWIAADSRQTD
jgi:hypothetical protein